MQNAWPTCTGSCKYAHSHVRMKQTKLERTCKNTSPSWSRLLVVKNSTLPNSFVTVLKGGDKQPLCPSVCRTWKNVLYIHSYCIKTRGFKVNVYFFVMLMLDCTAPSCNTKYCMWSGREAANNKRAANTGIEKKETEGGENVEKKDRTAVARGFM